MDLWICLLIAFAVWCLIQLLVEDRFSDAPGAWLAILLCLCFFSWLVLGHETEASKERRAAQAAKDAADAKPRVIREVDGCKVYAFKSGDRWHYFTRCAEQTTTESSYDVRSGKTTRTEIESITTTNGSKQ